MQYADNLAITHTESEFIMSFLQVQPPLVLEGHEPPTSVRTQCVARIIVSPSRMPQFIETLFKNWQRYTANYATPEDANAEPTEPSADNKKAE